jgi:asparagine synthase (glutamine-hydrolysing)
MCSILGILGLPEGSHDAYRARALQLSRLQRHRGPDGSGVWSSGRAVLAHERLAVVDVQHGAQPLVDPSGRVALAVNGEVYNHRALRAGLSRPYAFATESDCEVLLALWQEKGPEFLDGLQGMFAFALYDAGEDRWLLGRDPVGIVPLYTGLDEAGVLHVASELKALTPVCRAVREFPPGHLWDSREEAPRRYHHRAWRSYAAVAEGPTDAGAVRAALEESVRSHLMADAPPGVLLSGGLDSSIIAACAARSAGRRAEGGAGLHTFSIGLEGSPDLAAAEEVAAHVGSVHHGFRFTVQEGLDALSDVVHHLETYDVTTVRAATPMYLMARRIRALGVKVVLSGEGADELFGGYLYFHRAPDARALHAETLRKLDRLHLYDCLRANKAMAAWGVEARVPFLDTAFLDVAMGLSPAAKLSGARAGGGRMEKHLLREAFADALPPRVAWRQKEQFSDGVGYGWIDSLRAHAARAVADRQLAHAADRFPHNPPATKEAYLYRALFAAHFPAESCAALVPGGPSVACSTPEALAWDASLGAVTDPSGRAVRGVHQAAY